MRRHVVIGRLGPSDRTSVPKAAGEVATRLNLVTSNKRLDHGIGQAIDDLLRLNLVPSEVGVDLLVLAAHVHAADTRISRDTESQDTWTREIRLVVPVGDAIRWTPVAPTVERMLNFLTGDRWIVGFRQRPAAFAQCIPSNGVGRGEHPFNGVALFSGGLDSLIGAIDALEDGATPLLVSHAGEGATSHAQTACFDGLKGHYDTRPFERLRVWMSFPKALVRRVESDKTTRGRSFLFFTVGVFAGMGLGDGFVLQVPENGLISLNVPLDRLRLGALSTRTTHPFYIACWNDLIAKLEVSGRIETPYWNRTKGEMVSDCKNPTLLRTLLPSSLSCSSPSKARFKRRGMEHCGYCLPCIIRRAAIDKALGTGADPSRYTVGDLSAGILNTRRSEGKQIRSFQCAIERLQARPDLASLLIYKPGPLSQESVSRTREFADVYRRGMQEVGDLLAGVQTRPG